MKTIKILSALVFLTITTATIVAEGQERVAKTYQKEFTLTDNSSIYLENRFGQMNIENWDKNSISITIEIKVDYPEGDKATRLLKGINIEFTQVGNDINATTKIEEDFMKTWGRNFDSDSKNFSIDWEVKMPKQNNVTLVNRYGDIFVNELTGKSRIELRYGNLKANRIIRSNTDPLSTLSISYGNASIDEVNWYKAEIKYAKLNISKAKAIVILSRGSKIAIDQVNSVVTESRYDTYSIGVISNFVGEGDYTTFRIEELTKKLDLTVKYGDVKVDKIPAGFESIKFNGGYSGIYLGIDPSASYYLTGDSSYGNIKYNSSNRINRIENPTHTEVEGLIGTDETTKSKVNVTIKYGSARF